MRKNKEMENIGFFLKAVAKYGVKSEDQFQVKEEKFYQKKARIGHHEKPTNKTSACKVLF